MTEIGTALLDISTNTISYSVSTILTWRTFAAPPSKLAIKETRENLGDTFSKLLDGFFLIETIAGVLQGLQNCRVTPNMVVHCLHEKLMMRAGCRGVRKIFLYLRFGLSIGQWRYWCFGQCHTSCMHN